MAIPVMMPQIGENIETATIAAWTKKVNDPVTRGEILCKVETEKATLEIEAPESGVILALLYPKGSEAPVLKPIAYIGQPGDRIPKRGRHESADFRL